MKDRDMERREFIKTILAGIPVLTLDWDSFPRAAGARAKGTVFDAIIIGAGLAGLSCGAAFARQGYKVLVIEQHRIPGGYATSFKRKGFTFDVSLHSTTVGTRQGIANLIAGFPEIRHITFVPHQPLYRAIYPDYDIRVPHRDVAAYVKILKQHFPKDAADIDGIFSDMKGLTNDLNRFQRSSGKINMATFAKDFPFLMKNFNRTWGAMLEDRIKTPQLKAIISGLWGYFGLPPSKLSAFYYAMPLMGYLENGGYYPIGTSQAISNAFADIIRKGGGEIMLKTRVEKILTKDHAAHGVRVKGGREYQGRAVISNANAPDTFNKMLDEKDFLKDYLARLDSYSISFSSFQVWLGLKKDLVGKVGIKDSEIFYYTGYDIEGEYRAALSGDLSNPGFGLTLYDNLYKSCSPRGKNTLSIIATQGYDHWEKYEKDYFAGNKTAYHKEKKRVARILVDTVEKTLLPGLRDAIEVEVIGTPLTNQRYTGNPRGAIYGWNQTVDNSGNRRLQPKTPIQNLYLAGAWTFPGHGYGACIPSGLICFDQVMKEWQKKT